LTIHFSSWINKNTPNEVSREKKTRGFTTGCRMDGSTSHCNLMGRKLWQFCDQKVFGWISSMGDLSAEKWRICGSAIRKSMAHPRKKTHYYVPQMDAK